MGHIEGYPNLVRNEAIDMVGKRYNNLTVLALAGRDKHRRLIYRCSCDCGKEFDVLGMSVRDGHTRSCGCIRNEFMADYSRRSVIKRNYFKNVAHSVDDICQFKSVLADFVNDPAEWKMLINLRDKILESAKKKTAEKFDIPVESI